MIQQINGAITTHSGTITARDDEDTVARVEFPEVGMAQSFNRIMKDLGIEAKRQIPTSPKAVVVSIR